MSDKFPTNGSPSPDQNGENPVRPESNKKRGKPLQIVRFHSINIPVYAFEHHGKIRYTIAFYLNGRRRRREFSQLEDAKREARISAEKIMRGMQAQNDLRPPERESCLSAQRIPRQPPPTGSRCWCWTWSSPPMTSRRSTT